LYSNVKDWRRLKTTKYEKVTNEDDDEELVDDDLITKQDFVDDKTQTDSKTNQESEFNVDNKQKQSANKTKNAKKKSIRYVDLLLNKNDIIECLTDIAQQSLVPMFFSLMAIVLTYTVIGLTSCFDSIRTNCLMISKLT
jgi:hypothetical protein